MEKIVVDNLRKRTKHFVLDGINFTVHSGEIFAVVGIAESGKEMLVKTLQKLGFKSAGKVEINRRDVGTCVADQVFYPNASVWGTLKDSLRLNNQVATRREMKNILNLVGLKSKSRTAIKKLTPNRITRLKIAAAIVGTPGILILDDPFANLGEFESREIRVILKTLADKFDTAILLTARDFHGIEEIFDTVAIIEAGQIVRVETYNNLARLNAKYAKTCITTPSPNLAAKLITEEFGYPANIFEATDVIVDAHPDNSQAIYDFLVKKEIQVTSVTRVNKSIANLFDTLRSQRYGGVTS
ncbi:MAG: ATP-binding cassette domain-containing protein [Christensenellaceae bacterium]|jgi:ABC-type multidrug transport system ATPase subunit|nr:ATP-binding cassette domain-containing protein [Christensenellaceae bacterium]